MNCLRLHDIVLCYCACMIVFVTQARWTTLATTTSTVHVHVKAGQLESPANCLKLSRGPQEKGSSQIDTRWNWLISHGMMTPYAHNGSS